MSLDYTMNYLEFTKDAMMALNDMGLMETSDIKINPFTGEKVKDHKGRQYFTPKADFLREILSHFNICVSEGDEKPAAPFGNPEQLVQWFQQTIDRDFFEESSREDPDLPEPGPILAKMSQPNMMPVARYPNQVQKSIEVWFGVRDWTPLAQKISEEHQELFTTALQPSCKWISPGLSEHLANSVLHWLSPESLPGREFRQSPYTSANDFENVRNFADFFETASRKENFVLNLCGFN